LKVDEELRTEAGNEQLATYRREHPPKKPQILNILGEADKKEVKD